MIYHSPIILIFTRILRGCVNIYYYKCVICNLLISHLWVAATLIVLFAQVSLTRVWPTSTPLMPWFHQWVARIPLFPPTTTNKTVAEMLSPGTSIWAVTNWNSSTNLYKYVPWTTPPHSSSKTAAITTTHQRNSSKVTSLTVNLQKQ